MFTTHMRGSAGYDQALRELRRRGDADLARVERAVREILEEVRQQGDAAVCAFTERFEGRRQETLLLDADAWRARAQAAPSSVRDPLTQAAARIRAYHQHQVETGFRYTEDGVELGQRVRPLAAVAVYAPGGKARYPSSVLMTAVPAAVAGVPRIVLVTPSPTDEILVAAELAGVTEIVDAGGAQAIAAVAYGTQSITPVDKVVGPGNIYVACAKRLVFGTVDIDSIAGPSEALLIADDKADPGVVAADLLSQAEHDEAAYPLLITVSQEQATRIEAAVEAQLQTLPRAKFAGAALRDNGHCFVCGDLEEAARVSNALAPEHLSLLVADPDALLQRITAAGAVFMGYHTPEAAGDYAAGPSHVLPTGGAARFASPLGVYDFVVRSSLIRYSQQAIEAQGPLIEDLARIEGFEAHARAVAARRKG